MNRSLEEATDSTALWSLKNFQEIITSLFIKLIDQDFSPLFFQDVLEEAIKVITPAQAGSVLLLDKERYYFVAASGYNLNEIKSVTFSYEELIFFASADAASYVIANIQNANEKTIDEHRWKILQKFGRTREIKSTLIVPIYEGNIVAAALFLDNFVDIKAFGLKAQQQGEEFGICISLVLKQLRKQRKRQGVHQRLCRLLLNCSVPTLIFEVRSHKIKEVNASLLKLLGHLEEDVKGKFIDDVVCRNDYIKKIAPVLNEQGSVGEVEASLLGKNDTEYKCLVAADTLDQYDEPHVILTFVDITQYKQTEEEISEAVNLMLKDSNWFTRSFLEKLAQVRASSTGSAQIAPPALEELTQREQEVLKLVAIGMKNREISCKLGISSTTVKNHIARIYDKISVHSRSDAVIWARQRGLMQQE